MSFYKHESACIDENVEIRRGTKIWRFCHRQSGIEIGKN